MDDGHERGGGVDETETRVDWMAFGRAALYAGLSGLVVFALLAPVHGAQTIPPQCFSVVGYDVPCENAVAPITGAATALIVAVALWMTGRGTHRGSH
jgi:hypothetical protein